MRRIHWEWKIVISFNVTMKHLLILSILCSLSCSETSNSIISQINYDKMPLSSYTIIHKNTKLSERHKKLIVGFVSELRDNLNR